MGQLTNLYVSQSYQGLLKMTDSTNGLTNTLQTVQTGDGDNSPLQMSLTEVNISGSLTVNGQPISVNTGSLVTTASFNAYTSSVDIRFDGIELETGSLQNQINQKLDTGSFNTYSGNTLNLINTKLDTGSFNTYTSSVNTKLAGLDIETGSLQNQINGLATTGSLSGYTTTTVFNNYTGSNDAKVNSLISQTGSYVTETESGSFVTNVAGGPVSFEDQIIITKGNGSTSTITINNVTNADSSSFATNALSSSFSTNAVTSSISYDLIVYGKCNNPAGLTKGTIVRIVGANGDNPLFDTASWTDDANSANTLGMLTADVAYNAFQNIVVQGTVIGINTNGMTAGDMLYLSSSGQYTNVQPPAPYHEVRLGQVLRPQLNQGSAYISVDNGYELTELHDVDITSPVVGDVLTYVSGAYGQWVNKTGDELGYASTGSNVFNGNQTITGSVNITGNISATSASFTYVNTVYETASVIYSSGSNQFGDASNDTQTLWGTVNLPSGPLVVTGSVTSTGGFNGNLTGTASYATNALSASQAQNAVSASWAPDNSNRNGLINTGSIAGTQSITGSLILSGSSGIELDIKGDQIITGSLSVRSGSLFTLSNNTLPSVNPILFLSSSDAGQSNIIKGWGDNPTPGGAGAVQSNYTSSLRITGSNNTVSMPLIRATSIGGGVDQQGYISGSDNTLATNQSGIYLNTGSLLFPKTTNNYVGAASNILMNFTTSSLAGGHPTLQNNTLYAGGITINSNSGSINLSGNLINGGGIISTQNFVTNTRATVSANILGGTATLNHISSSIIFQNNIGNSPITVNNHLSSSITNNTLTVAGNSILGGFGGLGPSIWASGSQSSNVTRAITNNLIGGASIIISSSFVGSNTSNLQASLIYGLGLTVSGSQLQASGGSAFLGRFNETGSLASAQDIVFAVGTGTAPTVRRTSLYVTSGSLVGVSGSLDVKGVTNALTVTGSGNITHNIAGQPALTLVNSAGTGQPALSVTGSLNVTSTGDHSIIGNSTTITGSVKLSSIMNLQPQNPLPAGVLGDLAVSSSANLYFNNGSTWNLIV